MDATVICNIFDYQIDWMKTLHQNDSRFLQSSPQFGYWGPIVIFNNISIWRKEYIFFDCLIQELWNFAIMQNAETCMKKLQHNLTGLSWDNKAQLHERKNKKLLQFSTCQLVFRDSGIFNFDYCKRNPKTTTLFPTSNIWSKHTAQHYILS